MQYLTSFKRLALITALVVSSMLLKHSATLQAQSSVTCGYGNNATTFDNCLSGQGGTPQKAVVVDSNGNVGIGTTNPQGKLHVDGVMVVTGPDIYMGPSGRGDGGRAFVHDFNDVLGINYGGEFTGGTRIDGGLVINGVVTALSQRVYGPSVVDNLHVHGIASVASLQIRGGADLAEPFDIVDHEKIEPGMVVAIDPDNPGQLRLAKTAYDRMVAGVVSGAGGINSGLIMQQEGTAVDGEHPVALTGRVYVWVDATKNPVNPGDLLTTSLTPGHAMKVIDHEKAQGAILGKAMSKLEKGKGLVLILVTLQ